MPFIHGHDTKTSRAIVLFKLLFFLLFLPLPLPLPLLLLLLLLLLPLPLLLILLLPLSLPLLHPQDPEMKVYTALHLNAGLKYFFNKDTWDAVRSLDSETMRQDLQRYSFIRPPNAECTLQMGGLYVLDGARMLFGHMDRGLGAHARNEDVLAACASA